LQRISKDAQSNKYNDQVFKELQNYVQRLDAEIKQTKFVPLQRLKNVVDRAINNKIDEGFTADDEDMQNQLQYAPDLYNQYIGLDSSDEPFEAREKTANKILEKIINKKFTPVQASNFLLSHNRFAPKDSIPLLVNKLAETIPEKQFESAENSLKDAMLIKVFEPKQKNVNTMTANKYDALLQQNKDVFDSLFTNQELADLQSFKNNVVPEITKKTTTNPNQSKFLFVSALAETGLLGTKKSTSTTSSIQVARDSLKKLQKPLITPPQNIEPETDIAMSQDIPQIEVQEPNNLAENEEDMSFLQSNIGQFSLPQMNQPAFDMPSSDLAPPQMLSPTILPNEKDREIAMRQMGGLGSLS